jgi:hypothetical protein
MTNTAEKIEPSPARIVAMNAEYREKFQSTVIPMIEKALVHSNGELCLSVILQMLDEGEAVMLAATLDGEILGLCIGWKVVFQTGKTVLSVPITSGGKIHLWGTDMVAAWRKLAMVYGCSSVYGTGRPGWGKMLAKNGIKTIHHTYEIKAGE